MTQEEEVLKDFIREKIDEDLAAGRFDGRVRTRFPPEPNGYLHIGHAKSIVLNFGIAAQYNGDCNLRFDDTNPSKEDIEYVESMLEDIRWMGYELGDRIFYASDYFEQLYGFALKLIQDGKAYVDELSADEIREYRGTLTEPGRNSPHRNRPAEESLDLFERMRAGEFPNGSMVLRAKIDMASPVINLRDPVLYRIQHETHHRTGDDWCIYPMYDMAHGQSDSIEGVTHSLCTLEFENHRPLYDWLLENLEIYQPRQIEFARLNLGYTVLSKRRLIQLVEEGHVNGWDDPRMPTLSGLRRRGYTPEAIRTFVEKVGVARSDSVVDLALLEYHIRQDLNLRAPRALGVIRPLKVILTNYPEGKVEYLHAINNPEDETAGTRQVPFSRELYIEQDDFMEDPPRKYFRLGPGREVRLRYGYFIKFEDIVRNEQGEIEAILCTYDPETRGGYAPDGRKVRGTIHWVSAAHALSAEVRLYDRLFTDPNPLAVAPGAHFTDHLNADSLEVVRDARLEPSLADAEIGDRFQFERLGYFVVDAESADGKLVFNRTVTLRDTWARIQKARQSQNS